MKWPWRRPKPSPGSASQHPVSAELAPWIAELQAVTEGLRQLTARLDRDKVVVKP